MSEDRVIANTLERATSTDFNVAQATQARRLTDWIMAEHAAHAAPIPFQNGAGLLPQGDNFQSVVTGLNVFAGASDDVIYVGPGTLSQFSPPWDAFTGPAWTGARDPTTDIQTGVLRTLTAVPYVSTAGLGLNNNAAEAYHLLCARLAEVVVLTTTVDIFDVPTQAFVPTALTKRVELRIEFQWFLGAALNTDQTILPSLDAGGAEWEPLAYVAFVFPDGVNSASGANQGKVIDVARRVEGLTGGWLGSGGALALQGGINGIATQLSARLTSALSPDSGNAAGGALAGSVSAEINGERALLSISQDHRQFSDVDATDGSSPGDWDLVHYYLCPMQSATRRRWPLKTLLNTSLDADRSHVARGLIVGSTIQPTRQRKNSAPITLSSGGGGLANWAAMSAIPAGAAQYICSGHSLGTSAFNRIYPMVRTVGGAVLYPTGEYGASGAQRWLCRSVATLAEYELPINGILARYQSIDLRNIVPRTASAVLLHIEQIKNSEFDNIAFEIRNRVDNAANAWVGVPGNPGELQGQRLAQAFAPGGGFDSAAGRSSCTLRVPTGWVPVNNHLDATVTPADEYHFLLQLRVWSPDVVSGSAKTMAETHIRLLGWEE